MKRLPYADPTAREAIANIMRPEAQARDVMAEHVLDAMADPGVPDEDVAYLIRAIAPALAGAA